MTQRLPPAASRLPPTRHRLPPSSLLILLIVPLLLYGRTVGFGFVKADDEDLIAGNRVFLSDLRHAPRAFTRSYFEVEGELTPQKTYYRPAAVLSFMLDAAWGGVSPAAYHLTNIVLHATAVGLLAALAVAWGASTRAALAAALLFAVHPVNAQAVAWIAGRNDLLMAVFGLVSMIAFAAEPSRPVPHVLAFALALFSKETGILFPLLAVLHHRLLAGHRLSRLHWIALGCDASIAGAWAILRARALAGMPSELTLDTLHTVVVNAPQVLVHAGKMLVPLRLNVSPGVDAAGLAIGAAAAAVTIWAAWRLRVRRIAILAAAWALAFLVPTLVVAGLPAYEHRAYVPLMGLLACAAVAGRRVGRPSTDRQLVAGGAVIVLLAVLTYRRVDVFQNPLTYWTDASRDARFGPIAHVNLGQLHEAAGRPGDARREYLRALERDPMTPKAHNNLGVVLMALDEADLAVTHFREETVRLPWNADAWFNLGLWTEMHGRPGAARQYYERAIAVNPAYTPAYEKLGRESRN